MTSSKFLPRPAHNSGIVSCTLYLTEHSIILNSPELNCVHINYKEKNITKKKASRSLTTYHGYALKFEAPEQLSIKYTGMESYCSPGSDKAPNPPEIVGTVISMMHDHLNQHEMHQNFLEWNLWSIDVFEFTETILVVFKRTVKAGIDDTPENIYRTVVEVENSLAANKLREELGKSGI